MTENSQRERKKTGRVWHNRVREKGNIKMQGVVKHHMLLRG